MKILYSMIYAPEKGGSGAPIYVNHLLKMMNAKGCKSGIIYSTDQTYVNPKQEYYHSYPLRFDRPPIFDNQPKVPFSIAFKDMSRKQVEAYIDAFYQEYIRILSQGGYDLIHVQHGMYIGYVTALIKQKLRIPYILSLHNMEMLFLPEFLDPIYAMKAMVDADRILAITQNQKDRLLSTYSKKNIIQLEQRHSNLSHALAEKKYQSIIGDHDINPDHISICTLGINTHSYKVLNQFTIPQKLSQLCIPKTMKIVFYAGRLIEMKGIKYLLEAEKIYNKNHDVHTIVIGGGELEGFVKQFCVNPYIHYLGFIDQQDMPFYYNFVSQHPSVFCVPSASEAMGYVYLEAMRCGMQIVASCKKDLDKLDIMQQPNANFVDFGDVNGLGETLTRLLQKKVDRNSISLSVREYNLENFASNIYDQYCKVIGQK